MNYTNQKRRGLNNALRSLLPQLQMSENKDGNPFESINELPKEAKQEESITELMADIPYSEFAWANVVPVFIKVQRMNQEKSELTTNYTINYVNRSPISQQTASSYIADGKLYYIPGVTIQNHKR